MNMLGKKVRILDNSIVDIVNVGAHHEQYTGTVVGDSCNDDWCVELDNEGVDTYPLDMWSGVSSKKNNLIVVKINRLEEIR